MIIGYVVQADIVVKNGVVAVIIQSGGQQTGPHELPRSSHQMDSRPADPRPRQLLRAGFRRPTQAFTPRGSAAQVCTIG